MLTVLLTYRNRDITTVRRCLDSLQRQAEIPAVVFVDYGSDAPFVEEVANLLTAYPFVEGIACPVAGQLWNKSRAINIALKKVVTDYVFIGDVDMLFAPDFSLEIRKLFHPHRASYVQVGFLSEAESKKDAVFSEYEIAHLSSEEATGMTLFPTEMLREIGGYDEFYHGWGGEDTDVHVRLKNAGKTVSFFNEKVLLLHQWHPKHYRNPNSSAPFHPELEAINGAYLEQASKDGRIQANLGFESGKMPEDPDYEKLLKPEVRFQFTTEKKTVDAFLMGTLPAQQSVVEVVFRPFQHDFVKEKIKQLLGRKITVSYTLDEVNKKILETIVARFRNAPYDYQYDKNAGRIRLAINLKPNT